MNVIFISCRTVVGYIEEIISEMKFTHREKNIEFKIFKFIVNNNDGVRIQCNIYNENIAFFLPKLKLNQVNFNL